MYGTKPRSVGNGLGVACRLLAGGPDRQDGSRFRDAGDGQIVGDSDDDTYTQTRQAFRNVERAPDEIDASLEDVVSGLYVTESTDGRQSDAYGEVFDDVRPATSMIEVSRLIDPAMLVEIEAVAIVAE